MRIGTFNTEQQVLVIAEIGNNHEGSFDEAVELIHAAKESGADAIKFQTFITEHYVSKQNPERFNRLKSFELTQDQFRRLNEKARSLGLVFISTPFDLQSAKFLAEIVDAYKVGSAENTFGPLLAEVARGRKPVILSSGLATIDEVAGSKALIESCWKEIGYQGELAILHCVTSYPVPPEQANVGAIREMQDKLGCLIGYSDHTLGVDAALAAVALGARIVEKHFTLDRNRSEFRDHKISSDPAELKLLVTKIREVSVLLGSGKKTPQDAELAVVDQVRRSIVAGRDLPKGHAIRMEDLSWTRPSGGLKPGEEHLLIGRSLTSAVAMGDVLTLDILE